MRGLITALRTLTILPVPGADAPSLGAALPYFALVGALLGAALAGAAWLLELAVRWPAGEALLVVLGGAILTRGLHLDGLADWADGFGGGTTREQTLAIMKDPRKGAFGVAALILLLLAKWVALERLAALNMLSWLLAVLVVSRTAMVWLAARFPYARAEGGTAAPFVRDARGHHLWICVFCAAVLLVAVFGPAGLLPLVAGVLGAQLFGRWCLLRVGGVTGDLLGACGELTEVFLLLAAAALGPRLLGWQVAAWGLLGL
jgi:adenosylcobinamide-GDP ribazoletransferase